MKSTFVWYSSMLASCFFLAMLVNLYDVTPMQLVRTLISVLLMVTAVLLITVVLAWFIRQWRKGSDK